MNDIAIRFDHVGKLYKLGLVGTGTLAERFAEAYKLAEETVDSGKAEALFDKWIETAKSKA